MPPCPWGVPVCGARSLARSRPRGCAVLLRVILRQPAPSQWPQELESQDGTGTSLSELGSRALLRDGPPGSHDNHWSPGRGWGWVGEVEEGTGKAFPRSTKEGTVPEEEGRLLHMDRKDVAGRSRHAGGGQRLTARGVGRSQTQGRGFSLVLPTAAGTLRRDGLAAFPCVRRPVRMTDSVRQ